MIVIIWRAIIIGRTIVILPIVAVVIARVVTWPAFALLFLTCFLAAAEICEHTKIVVGKLQVIFGIDAVAIKLRILCQFLVFFEHLRCVAARTIIDQILIVKTAAVVVLLPVVVAVVIATAATIVVILLLPVVGIHQG
jgi:hypothetical protein